MSVMVVFDEIQTMFLKSMAKQIKYKWLILNELDCYSVYIVKTLI